MRHLTIAAALLLATQAHALTAGDKFSGHVDIAGKQIPLPAGDWVLAGLGTQTLRMPELGAFGTIQSAVLLLPRDGQVIAVLEVNTNAIPVNDGWGRTRACTPDEAPLMIVVRYMTGWENSCQSLRPTRFDANSTGPEAWEKARGFAQTQKLGLAPLWLTAWFRVSDRQDIVDLRYHIAPSLLLGPAALPLNRLDDWSNQSVKEDILRQGAVSAVAAWATGMDAWVERGLRNQIATTPGPLPELGVRTAAYHDAKQEALHKLYVEGRISKESFAAQSEKARAEAPEFKPQTSVLSNSVKKNISFRSLGTFVDFGIAYLVTASNAISWGIALTLNASDSLWFVMNDQYWDDRYARLNTHDSERFVDFILIGESSAS